MAGLGLLFLLPATINAQDGSLQAAPSVEDEVLGAAPGAAPSPSAAMTSPANAGEPDAAATSSASSQSPVMTFEEYQNAIRKAYADQKFTEVIALTDQLKTDYPNEVFNDFYRVTAERRISELSNPNRPFRSLRDAAPHPLEPIKQPVVEPGQPASDAPETGASTAASTPQPVAPNITIPDVPGDSLPIWIWIIGVIAVGAGAATVFLLFRHRSGKGVSSSDDSQSDAGTSTFGQVAGVKEDDSIFGSMTPGADAVSNDPAEAMSSSFMDGLETDMWGESETPAEKPAEDSATDIFEANETQESKPEKAAAEEPASTESSGFDINQLMAEPEEIPNDAPPEPEEEAVEDSFAPITFEGPDEFTLDENPTSEPAESVDAGPISFDSMESEETPEELAETITGHPGEDEDEEEDTDEAVLSLAQYDNDAPMADDASDAPMPEAISFDSLDLADTKTHDNTGNAEPQAAYDELIASPVEDDSTELPAINFETETFETAGAEATQATPAIQPQGFDFNAETIPGTFTEEIASNSNESPSGENDDPEMMLPSVDVPEDEDAASVTFSETDGIVPTPSTLKSINSPDNETKTSWKGPSDDVESLPQIEPEEEDSDADLETADDVVEFAADETIAINITGEASDEPEEDSVEEEEYSASETGDRTIRDGEETVHDSANDLFSRELNRGGHARKIGEWDLAVHHFSIAAALRPDASEVKDLLREARRNRNKDMEKA